jgi:superfamily I DNA/RNA helicase
MSSPTLQQQAVIDNRSKYLIVVACPGSGKTTTLINRVKALPTEEGKLLLAFNVEAVNTIKDRLKDYTGKVKAQTLHAYCMGQVSIGWKELGFSKKPELHFGNIKNDILLANRIRAKSLEDTDLDADLVEASENSIKDSYIEWHSRNYDINDPLSYVREQTLQCIKKYREWLMHNDWITFASAVRLCAQRPDIVKVRYGHVMVDEFQDVDQFQMDVISFLASFKYLKTMVCVGDPNQRIYDWRGALADSFLEFCKKVAPQQVHQLPLTTNFRSRDNIIQFAEGICKVGMKGVRGPLVGSIARIHHDHDIPRFIDPKVILKEHACLSRYNRHTLKIAMVFMERKIPFNIVKGMDIFEQPHVKYAIDNISEKWGKQEERDKFTGKFSGKEKYARNNILFQEHMDDFIYVRSLTKEQIDKIKKLSQNPEGVQISTIHKTKGMEWDRVVLCFDNRTISEVCVMYVGSTRARDNLFLYKIDAGRE